jgi:hypothetical protein
MTIASHLPAISPAQASSALRHAALSPGQTVEGRVHGPAPDGGTLVQIGRQSLSLSLPASVSVGTLLSLRVEQADGQLRLALIGARPPSTPQLPATNVDISQASRPAQAPLTYGPPATPAVAAVPVAAPAVATLAPAIAPSAATPGLAGIPPIAPVAPPSSAIGAQLQSNGAPPFTITQPGPNGVAPYGGGLPPTPQAVALNQMVQRALPLQASLGGLTGLLPAALGQLAFPEPVLKAARQILDNQLVPRGGSVVDASALKTAVQNSGVFQEARLAAGAPAGSGTDTKSGLLALQKSLGQWLGNQAQIAAAAPVPPPLRNVLPRARLPEAPSVLPVDPEEAGRMLLERTDAALSRVRLHQHASLPDHARPAEPSWSMEIPIMAGLQQAILQLQIQRDGTNEGERAEERGWQVRFAVNLPTLGEVGAQISLRAQTVGVMLWADESETARGFEAGVEDLRLSLMEAGLLVGAVVIRRGAPGELLAAGRVLDATL